MTPTERTPTTLRHAIAEYTRFKVDTKQWKARESVQGGRIVLKCFLDTATNTLGRDPLTTDLDDAFVLKCHTQRWGHTKPSTQTAALVHIRLLARWLMTTEYAHGPLGVVALMRVETPAVDPPIITREEVEKVFTVTHPRSPRDAWLVRLIYELARRPREMREMLVGDFDPRTTPTCPYGRYAYRESKTHQGKIWLDLTKTQREYFEGWLADYERALGYAPQKRDYMFPGSIGRGPSIKGHRRVLQLIPHKQMDAQYICYAIGTAYKEAGVKEPGKSGHAARRGNLTEVHDDLQEAGYGNAMDLTAKKSGHKDLGSLSHYLRRSTLGRQATQAQWAIDAARRGETPKPAQETPTPPPQVTTGEGMATVINMFDRRATSA